MRRLLRSWSEEWYGLEPQGDCNMMSHFKRFWHCLFTFHRAVTVWKGNQAVYIGCECGKHWKGQPEDNEFLTMSLRRKGQMAKRDATAHPAYLTPAEHQKYLVEHSAEVPDLDALYAPQNTDCRHCSNRALILVRKDITAQIDVQCGQCLNSFKHIPGVERMPRNAVPPTVTPTPKTEKKPPRGGDDT